MIQKNKNTGKRKRKKSKLLSIIFIVLFIILFIFGLFIMLYPTISNYIVSISQNHDINVYESELDNTSKEEKEAELAAAHEYNAGLNENSIKDVFGSDRKKINSEYFSLLNVKDDIMGYIEIPKINVKLPIYHGTSDEVLNKGVGHVAGSSLPVGGDKTHAVLAGHRGLPSSKLFTDLDMVAEGDLFYIYVLDEKLAYVVDNISIVEPTELDMLDISDHDYITLVTCTPYAINTHRLLVRGTRTEVPEEEVVVVKEIQLVSKDSRILLNSILAIDFVELLILIKVIIDKKRAKKKLKKARV